MDIIKIIAIAFVTVTCVVLVKQVKPELSIFVVIAGSIVMLFLIIQAVGTVFGEYKSIIEKTGLSSNVFTSVLKMIGIGYVVEFAGDICSEAGVPSISQKILFAGKILILIMCMPIIKSLVSVLLNLMP